MVAPPALNKSVCRMGAQSPMKVMVCDVSGAYVNALAMRPVHAQLADEDKEPCEHDKCGRLTVSTYVRHEGRCIELTSALPADLVDFTVRRRRRVV